MAHFTTKGKLYREGTDLDAFGALDVTVTAPGTTVEQTAPSSLPDSGGVSRSFLYWDTGRRITGKRKVRWTFNHPANWSNWPAAAYYGVPGGGGPGTPVITVDAHWVGVGPIDPTPIDGPGSTFVNGPGPTPAWPSGGNDHRVRTEWGAANIHAKDHLQRNVGDPILNFSSWQQLVYGGDSTDVFEENDDDILPGSGVTGIVSSTSQFFPVAQGVGGFLMAGYVPPDRRRGPDRPGGRPDWDIFRELVEILREKDLSKFFPPDRGDPSPEDIIRLKLISESLDLVRGGTVTPTDAFDGLVGAANKMSAAQLKRTILGTKATLNRGQAALKALEALAKRKGPGR